MLCSYIPCSFFLEREILKRQQERYQQKCYAPNSILAWNSQVKRYLQFVAECCPDFSPLPCNATQVALYATWLARNLKFSSIKNYLSGLNYSIRQNGFPPNDFSDFVLESTLRGIKRELGDSPKQAIPILPSMLRSSLALGLHTTLVIKRGEQQFFVVFMDYYIKAKLLCLIRS